MSNFDTVKERAPLQDYIDGNLEKIGNKPICPVCGSGKGRNHTPALKVHKDRWKCFSCGTSGDVFDLAGVIHKTDSKTEQLRRVASFFNIPLEGKTPTAPKPPTEPKRPADYSGFYKQAHANLMQDREALEYLHSRGITDESIERFNLGYVRAWNHPKSPGRYQTKRIIIPRTKATYTARAIDETEPNYSDRYKKQVAGSQRDLFNLDGSRDAEIIVVVEGELDAISVMQQTDMAAVGLGSISNIESFAAQAHETARNAIYLLALDDDGGADRNSGQEAQERLSDALTAKGIYNYPIPGESLYMGFKDANDLLIHDPAHLSNAINRYADEAVQDKAIADGNREAEALKRTGAGMLMDFMESIKTRRYEPIPTGINYIDRAINGGFIRKTLVMIAAAPGAGKTTLSQQILENMAKRGHEVLFICLEMDREQLLARSLSRICANNGHSITPLEILRGYEWSHETEEAIYEAGQEYLHTISEHFIYNPYGASSDLESIVRTIEAEALKNEAAGKKAPIVCVDYLQYIEGTNREDDVTTMKRAVKAFKDYAIRHDTVSCVITATNRESNKTGRVDQASGRDTSAIEYSADLLLGLSYSAIENGDEVTLPGGDRVKATMDSINQIRNDAYRRKKPAPIECRTMALKVLKNRFGEMGRKVDLVLDGEHSAFKELEYRVYEPRML